MNENLKQCPFCHGNAKISARQTRFIGQNYLGVKQIKYAVYGMCNRCKATGPHVYGVIYYGTSEGADYMKEMREVAAEKWNRGVEND